MASNDLPLDPRVPSAKQILSDWIARLEALRADARRLRCAECGVFDDGRRGWTMRLTVDNELAASCPDCDEREFGGDS